MCANPLNHDWAQCPFAHPKDRARRRPPALTHMHQPCPDKMQGGECPRGGGCPYTHSVAEYWCVLGGGSSAWGWVGFWGSPEVSKAGLKSPK